MSVSSVSLSSDANVRYQKLATEYSKLRSQAKVLREGVLTERAKIDTLTDELKSKESLIRKLETENESLTFRNEQLVKRVENLQIEVETKVDSRKDKSSKKSNSSSKDVDNQLQSMTSNIGLLEGELRNKIRQNEDLISQIAEIDRIHADEMAQMSDKFAKELRSVQKELNEMQKSRFTVKREKEKKSPKVEKEIVEKPLMDDSKNTTIDSLSVIPDVCEVSSDVIEISSPVPPQSADEAYLLIAESTKSVFSALHNVFNLMQQRSEIYPFDITLEPLPKHVQNLALKYAQCAKLFFESGIIIDEFLEKAQVEIKEDVPKVLSKIDLISKHCHTMLLESVKQMRDEENKMNWSTPPMVNLNDQWADLMEKMFLSFTTIHATLVENEHGQRNEEIVEELRKFSDVCSDLLSVFSRRWIHESRLPTTTRRMRCIGSALESSIKQLAAESVKLHARARTVAKMMIVDEDRKSEEMKSDTAQHTSDMNPFGSEEEKPTPTVETKPAVFEQLCSKCNCSITGDTSEALLVPKSQNLEEQSIPNQKEDEENEAPVTKKDKIMNCELEVLREKLQEFQSERDKNSVDLALLKRKFELANGNKKYEMSDIDHLREIGRERTKELLKRAHKAECGARFYKKECEVLVTFQIFAENEKEKIKGELEELVEQKHNIEDELASVRRSYETQIGELSDHVTTLMKAEKDRLEAEKPAPASVNAIKEPISRGRASIKSFFKS